MKKALILGLSLSLALTLAACGGSNDNAADNSQNASASDASSSVDVSTQQDGSTPETEGTSGTTSETTTTSQSETSEETTTQQATETPAPEVEAQPEVQLFTDCNETVYATTTVNVRDTYSTSGNKVGSLTKAQSVKRTGTGQGEAAGWKKYIVSLAEYAGTEYFRFAFRGYSDYNEAVILVDNVTVESMAGGIEQMRQADAISAYPNPTSGIVHIGGAAMADVEVYSADGRLIGDYKQVDSVDLTNNPRGIYVLKVTTGDASTMLRVVKK